jgi:hypothetical protein
MKKLIPGDLCGAGAAIIMKRSDPVRQTLVNALDLLAPYPHGDPISHTFYLTNLNDDVVVINYCIRGYESDSLNRAFEHAFFTNDTFLDIFNLSCPCPFGGISSTGEEDSIYFCNGAEYFEDFCSRLGIESKMLSDCRHRAFDLGEVLWDQRGKKENPVT